MVDYTLLIAAIKTISYIICYGLIFTGVKNFKAFYEFSYYGVEAQAIIDNIRITRVKGGVKATHYYHYEVDDNIINGKFVIYNEDYKINDEVNILYLSRHPNRSHYPQPGRELISTALYSIAGLYLLFKVTSTFS